MTGEKAPYFNMHNITDLVVTKYSSDFMAVIQIHMEAAHSLYTPSGGVYRGSSVTPAFILGS